MEAQAVQALQFSSTLHSNLSKPEKTWPNGSLRMFGGFKKQPFVSSKLQSAKPSTNIRRRTASLVVACSNNNVPGMMGSGKTTVGRILSRELSYSFFDRFLLNIFCIYGSSDELVKEEVDGTSVADIFKLYGEPFFRNKETEVLQKLSLMHRHVISTGGGAVLMPNNWKFMRRGISVWLDVPVEALAQRITAVGTDSRPLLHSEAGNAYMEFQDEAPRKLKRFKVCKFSGMVHSKTLGRTEPNGSLRMSSGFKEQVFVSSKLRPARPSTSIWRGTAPIEVTCLHNNAPGCCKNCSYFDNLPTTEVLRRLSMMHRHIISTGGGAVVRPINWYNN
ncbi:hypothetical protein JHK86_015324 [Glycine max]|nr:hypothetical protein JHK86_015324 [Glycine max]